MSFASLRRVLRSARKGLCSTCSKARYPQLEAAGAGHVGCLIYTFETLGQMIKDDHDVTAMHVAARKGQISVLIYIVENSLVGATPIAKNGATPAHDAAGTGNLDCLRYILSHTKASANDVDSNNATPLHWAVQSGRLKIVQWLVVEAHAPIDSMAKNGVTPIHIAAAKNYLEILRWLIGHAYRNHPKPMRLVNARDKNGATPLYHAAHAGNGDISRWLAEKGGGDPTIFSAQGLAPLHAATIAGHFETVAYLFQFGSATAPGGLRTTEGVCAVHFAAGEGHVNILKWLLKQKECSGNERDYYQSTPMHDAAEHGHLKIIQVLCEHGADATLTDIEGNTPRDLAQKNGQYKCAKYLAAAMKQKVPRATNRTLVQGPSENSRGLSRQKHTTRAEMIDSYRNAPPHQLPLNVFDMEDEELEDLRAEGNEQWETLRDLMGEQEIKTMETEGKLTGAEQRQRKLEEDMRREMEQRKRKRREQLQREQEYEKEIRDRLIAEEKEESLRDNEKQIQKTSLGAEKKGKGGIRKRKKSDPASYTASTNAQLRRLSLPVNLGSDAQVTQRGLVEKRTKEFESRSPAVGQKGGRGILSKLWPKKTLSAPSTLLPHSQSWDSSFSQMKGMNPYDEEPTTEDDQFNTNDEDLPEPPPIPTVEYLLGRRAVNLRKRASLEDNSIQNETHDSDDYDSDSHSSVGSSRKGHHKKKSSKRKKRKSQGDARDDGIQWQYNKLRESQSSSQVEKKSLGRQRKLTPIPSEFPTQRKMQFQETMPQPLKLDFGPSVFYDKSKDIEPVALSSSPDTPSSLSPLHSPSPKSPLSPTSPMSSKEASPSHINYRMGEQPRPARVAPLPPVSLQSRAKSVDQEVPNNVSQNVPAALRITQPKRPAPKLPPHLQNRQSKQQIAQNLANTTQSDLKRKASPISKIASSRGKSNQQGNNSKLGGSPSSPDEFMAVLNKAISSSPEQPRIFRQTSRDDSSPSSSPGTHSPTIEQIELELIAMKTMLASSVNSISEAPQRPPSPETPRAAEEERDALTSESDESSEYTSSSESSTSDTEDTSSDSSSEDEPAKMRPLSSSPRRPIMARNIGMASPCGKKFGGFNRARLLARYPRLLSRKIMRLATIHEVPEELVHQAETTEEQATIFYRLSMEKKCMKAWRKYMQIMKSAIRKAEKMAQRKKRDILAKTFYAWIQVRNIAAVEKVDNMEKARAYFEKKLLKKVFEAWLFLRIGAHMPIARSTSLQLLNAEERYLSWLNEQLLSVGKHVENISESLADGVLMIQALVHASGKKPPKYNPRPKVKLHRQDNWKMAHEFMKTLGVNVKGIEPADLANVVPAAIHNMFTNVLKWHEKYQYTAH